MQQSNLGYQVLQQALIDDHLDTDDMEAMCVTQVRDLLQAVESKNLYSLRVLDSWGKFPQGLLYGHFMDMGNYDSCLSLENGSSKYCLANIQFESLQANSIVGLTLSIGTCMPSTCSAEQLNRWLTNYLNALFADNSVTDGTLVQEGNCALAQNDPMTGLDWFAVCLFAILGGLVLLATVLDYAKVSSKPLMCFSLRQNVPQLVRTSTTSSPHVIPCLNGIRCLTIIWIIYGHGYMYLLLSPSVNALEVSAWAETPFSMILQSGTISVDTFFLLSGMLLVMSTLRHLERNSGSLNIPLMYLHRIVRLTPVLAVAVLFFMTLFVRLDSGPLWQQFTSQSQLCSETWWATLLYVQNYAAAGRMCLGHSWYLAVDMQLYILSPIFLISLYKWGKKTVVAIVVLIVLLMGCVFSIVMLNDLQVFNRDGNLGEDSPEMRLIYYTTNARANPWFIGLLFGYFLHCNRNRRRLPRWFTLLLWLISFALLATVIFAMYPYTQEGSEIITPLAGAFYLCFSRIAWSLALCWLIWTCHTGQAGIINSLLSWSFWEPLSRISYCLYIWHLIVETVHTARIKTSVHFSNYDAILNFWSHFGVTLIVSVVMYLCIEVPLVKLETYLLSHRKKETPRPQSVREAVAPIGVSQQNLVDA
ncbi:nose resistant to fluoxetine protein 6 [Drosophila willistoni]|nr:nose resistant to fluoxetine protein 6 [Drosophila willistoni]